MMMKLFGDFCSGFTLSTRTLFPASQPSSVCCYILNHCYNSRRALAMSTSSEEAEMEELLGFLDNLKNYEKAGVPKGAGTDSEDGFDLGRMRRLLQLLGNPHSKFKVGDFASSSSPHHFLLRLLLHYYFLSYQISANIVPSAFLIFLLS